MNFIITKDISIIIVFLQGMASFLSPCVLPLIPAYLTYLTGKSAEAMIHDRKAHRMLIWNGAAFVAGFTIIFVLLGATATGIGKFLLKNNDLFRQIGGIIVIVFGLFHMGLVPISFLNYEKRLQFTGKTPGLFSSMLMGIGFSFGWTPCIGPVLSAVLIIAGRTSTVWGGIGLLAVYSLGLGVPFLVLTIFLKYLWKYFKDIYKYMKIIKVVSGAILVVIGVLILTNTFGYLATFGF